MKYKFDTNYTKEELLFIKEFNCEILSEIKLSKTNFSENEIPKRMFKYCGTYIGEVFDYESNELAWAVLSKWKGVWHFSSYYYSLEDIVEGL